MIMISVKWYENNACINDDNCNNNDNYNKFIARPKDGLFRLHASWIYLSYAGFDCLAAILCH